MTQLVSGLGLGRDLRLPPLRVHTFKAIVLHRRTVTRALLLKPQLLSQLSSHIRTFVAHVSVPSTTFPFP